MVWQGTGAEVSRGCLGGVVMLMVMTCCGDLRLVLVVSFPVVVTMARFLWC